MPSHSLCAPCLGLKFSARSFLTRLCATFVRPPLTSVSPFAATLTNGVKDKSFPCRCYKKHRGARCHVRCFARPMPLVTSACLDPRAQPQSSQALTSQLPGYPEGRGVPGDLTRPATAITSRVLPRACGSELSSFRLRPLLSVRVHQPGHAEHGSRLAPS